MAAKIRTTAEEVIALVGDGGMQTQQLVALTQHAAAADASVLSDMDSGSAINGALEEDGGVDASSAADRDNASGSLAIKRKSIPLSVTKEAIEGIMGAGKGTPSRAEKHVSALNWDVSASSFRIREFLDAASNGDVEAVDAWLASDPCGDVNVVRGEGWTALLYAVSRSHLSVARRLVTHRDIDLNATTVVGTSALAMSLKRRNNTMTRLLLAHGASRCTIRKLSSVAAYRTYVQMNEALASTWMWADVKRMLSPQWSVRWSPELHARFPSDQREKCRLVVFANTLALRKARRRTHHPATDQHSQSQEQSQSGGVASSALYGLSESAKLFVWNVFDSLGITERSGEEERERLVSRTVGGEGGGEMTVHQTDSIATIPTRTTRAIHWVCLPQPIVHHILEFAIYLW